MCLLSHMGIKLIIIRNFNIVFFCQKSGNCDIDLRNGLPLIRTQTIIWTNAEIFVNRALRNKLQQTCNLNIKTKSLKDNTFMNMVCQMEVMLFSLPWIMNISLTNIWFIPFHIGQSFDDKSLLQILITKYLNVITISIICSEHECQCIFALSPYLQGSSLGPCVIPIDGHNIQLETPCGLSILLTLPMPSGSFY